MGGDSAGDDEGDAAVERRPLLSRPTSSGGAPAAAATSTGGGPSVEQEAPREVVIAVRSPRAGSGMAPPGDEDDGSGKACRICFDGEETPENPLISPCLCRGGSRYVHRACLQQWRTTNHRDDAFYQCEVCKFKYAYSRAWWASILGSNVTLGLVFSAAIGLLVYGLGFLPIAGSDMGEVWGPVATHVFNGVVGLGILGLLASLILGLMRAFGAAAWLAMPDAAWCPAAVCADCSQTGGLPLCMELGGAGECGVAMAALLGLLLIAAGILASALLTWQLLLVASGAALERAQRMVENVGEAPAASPATPRGQQQQQREERQHRVHEEHRQQQRQEQQQQQRRQQPGCESGAGSQGEPGPGEGSAVAVPAWRPAP